MECEAAQKFYGAAWSFTGLDLAALHRSIEESIVH
jgi:hypothetical protein